MWSLSSPWLHCAANRAPSTGSPASLALSCAQCNTTTELHFRTDSVARAAVSDSRGASWAPAKTNIRPQPAASAARTGFAPPRRVREVLQRRFCRRSFSNAAPLSTRQGDTGATESVPTMFMEFQYTGLLAKLSPRLCEAKTARPSTPNPAIPSRSSVVRVQLISLRSTRSTSPKATR